MTAGNQLNIFTHLLLAIMSGVKPITSYFPVLTKDQLEIVDLLLDNQSSKFEHASVEGRIIKSLHSMSNSLVFQTKKIKNNPTTK